jgi:hypothetical protein
MANRVNVDHVPQLVRPKEVEQAIEAAVAMRERAREAAEAAAAAQKAVDEAEGEDLEAAAARARAGQPLGAQSRTLVKAREELLLKQRDATALRLAAEGVGQEVVDAIGKRADAWVTALGKEQERAREQGRQALVALEDACARIGAVASAQQWIAAAQDDGRFDRPPRMMFEGSLALSSKRRTANSEPMQRAELLGYVGELLEPLPAPEPAVALEADVAQA